VAVFFFENKKAKVNILLSNAQELDRQVPLMDEIDTKVKFLTRLFDLGT